MRIFKRFLLLFIFLCSVNSFAQETRTSYRFRIIATTPAFCNRGDVFYVSDVKKFKFCYDTNTLIILGTGVTANSTVGNIPYLSSANIYSDSPFFRVDANTISQRNLANAQTFQLYNTTDSGLTNFERGWLSWVGNVFKIGTEAGGTGTARNLTFVTGGTDRFTINNSDQLLAPNGSASAPSFSFSNSTNTGMFQGFGGTGRLSLVAGGKHALFFSSSGSSIGMLSDWCLGFSSQTTDPSTLDTILCRDAANTLALRNGVNPQTLRVYNTLTDANNNEFIETRFLTNVAGITTIKNGTGVQRNLNLGGTGAADGNGGIARIKLWTDGTIDFFGTSAGRWTINSSGHFVAATDNTYDIGAIGATRPRNIYAANEIRGSSFYLVGGGGLGTILSTSGSTDGIITLTNFAGSSFGRLQFGGTSASFPAIKRNGAQIDFRLADDSDYANFRAKSIQVSGSSSSVIDGNGNWISIVSGSSLYLGSASQLFFANTATGATADAGLIRSSIGIIKVTNGSSNYGTLDAGNLFIAGVGVYQSGTPSIAGNATLNTNSKDSAGKITSTGTGSSTAVLTFATAFTRAPACFVTNETTANLVRPVSTTTTLTINATVVTGDSLSYICLGY